MLLSWNRILDDAVVKRLGEWCRLTCRPYWREHINSTIKTVLWSFINHIYHIFHYVSICRFLCVGLRLRACWDISVLDSGLLTLSLYVFFFFFPDGPRLFCRISRHWMSSPIRVWRMPASHLRPLLDESQRFLMARGVFAMHRVSTASHHQLLLQRKETLLQTRLPTVSAVAGRGIYALSLPLHFFRLFGWCAVISKNIK